jgi:hypothetical protein
MPFQVFPAVGHIELCWSRTLQVDGQLRNI